MKIFKSTAIVIAFCWIAMQAGVTAERGRGPASGKPDWPTFQGGPGRDGLALTPAIKAPRVLWKTKIGVQSWLNNPVIAFHRVYVGSSGKTWNQPDDVDGVYCLNLDDGKVQWFSKTSADANGVAYAAGLIVATADDGSVRAIESASGTVKWSKKGENEKMYTNPLIVSGLVIVGDSGGLLYAFNLKSGALVWKVELSGAIRGGASWDGSRIYAAGQQGEVVALDLGGKQKWKVETQNEIYAAPTVAGEFLCPRHHV